MTEHESTKSAFIRYEIDGGLFTWRPLGEPAAPDAVVATPVSTSVRIGAIAALRWEVQVRRLDTHEIQWHTLHLTGYHGADLATITAVATEPIATEPTIDIQGVELTVADARDIVGKINRHHPQWLGKALKGTALEAIDYRAYYRPGSTSAACLVEHINDRIDEAEDVWGLRTTSGNARDVVTLLNIVTDLEEALKQ